MNIEHLFLLGMKKQVVLRDGPMDGLRLNLGPGNSHIPGTKELDLPEWDAEIELIPYDDNTVAVIHAYHFLEHIDNIVGVLRECQRVLVHGGLMYIAVPWYGSRIAFQDVDHKRFFASTTWKKLFANPYYDKDKKGWRLVVDFNMIMGLDEDNLMLFTQLRKK